MSQAIPFEELKKAAEPLINLLKQYGDFHSAIVVTRENIVFTQEVQGVPVEIEN